MQLMLEIDIPRLPMPVTYHSKVLMLGSCFTEHMSERLSKHKFDVCANPHGILYSPLAIANALESYIEGRQYTKEDLFQLNELWNSWEHHTRFSHLNAEEALQLINQSQKDAADYLQSATHLVITLGSAFQYYLVETGEPVANNHKAPSQWFEKHMLTVDVITDELHNTIEKLEEINPALQIIFTVSPVRHIRDGLIENNRSKARLIDAVYELCAIRENCHYFPAYELVIDILRDYRFYEADFVHPNKLASSYVWEQFVKSCMDAETTDLMKHVGEINTAVNHRPRFPDTQAHTKFKATYAEKVKSLQEALPYIDWSRELAYFECK